MERKTVQSDQEKSNRLSAIAKNKGGLCRAIWEYSQEQYGVENKDALWEELTKIYGKAPELLETEDEFWKPELEQALAALAGESFVTDMKQIVHMRMKGHFSGSTWRRSYRSGNFRYYVTRIISDLKSCLLLTLQKQNVEEMLYCHYEWIIGYDVRLALELYRNNERCVNPVEEAILGENSEVLLGPIIWAIVISGNEELLDLLLKLLVTARLQEGLRQMILECADLGSVETQIRILKVCLDEDMFRFSSVIRAFNTWTGLGYMDVKADTVKKYAALAYEYLTDPGSRECAANSENNLEAYLALWATGCYEIQDTDRKVEELLRDKAKYRRILGWYFVSHTDSSFYRMRKAMENLDERDEELLAWVVRNLSTTRLVLGNWTIRDTEPSVIPAPNSDFPADKKKREELFRKLKEIALLIGNRNKEFKGNPFPFSCISLSVERVISCLMSVAGYDMDLQMIDELIELFPYMTVEQRQAVYGNFLAPDKVESHRRYYLDALKDKSITVRQLIVRRLSECTLQERDILVLCESLRTKNSDMRKSVISVLVKQTPNLQRMAVQNLLETDEESQIQAGIEMLLELREDNPKIMEAGQERVGVLLEKSLSTQTEILLKRLVVSENDSEETYTKENGFGLYDPAVAAEHWKTVQEEKPAADTLWTEEQLRDWIPSDEDYMKILERMSQVFVRHADYEYEIEMHDGSRRKVLLGDGYSLIPAEYGCESRLSEGMKLTMIPFWEEFVQAAGEYAGDVRKILGLMYVTARYDFRPYDSYYYEVQDWFKPIESKNLEVTYIHWDKYKTLYWHMVDVIQLFVQQADAHEVFETAFAIYQSMIAIVGEENLGKNMIQVKEEHKERRFPVSRISAYPMNMRMIGYWRVSIGNMSLNDEDFKRWFLTECRLEHLSGVSVYGGLFLDAYFRACDEKVIPLDTLYDWLIFGNKQEFGWYDRFVRMNGQNRNHICILTNPVRYKSGRDIYERYPWAKDTVNSMVLRIVEVESRRGELATDVTELATQIVYFEGAEYFCSLLAALGKDSFFRGYYYSDNTKKAVLSQLLKRCYPAEEDTPEKLGALLKKTDIKEKRLAEAVMYAPQWAELAEKLMGWQGLKKAVWFFHAHISEHFSAEKETEVAIYSRVSPQQFTDGVFDKNWFLDAYEALGEKRFQVLYKSAKYITSGNNQHRRSQLYADAALGKLDTEEFAAEIMDKRNQEKLRAYAVIPIPEDKPEELLHRYEFIQRFLKESCQFGAQRRESEKKACRIALENLAITSGFGDVNRMTWYLESEKIEEIRPLMKPVEMGGVSIYLDITADGIAELAVRKADKVQKTLPAALKKNETVLRIKEIVKELKEQRSRARKSLETAMVERTVFGVQELKNIVRNPVISPMLFSLVWTDGTQNGFLKPAGENTVGEGKKIEDNVKREIKLVLKNLCGQSRGLNEEEVLYIAHPYDLRKTGEWVDYMHFLYEQKLVQPFKQVFREFYPITEDEIQEKTVSRRYAGYQVQPQRTVALLKDRGWTVDYAEGLQRVCYQENLIVRMYALADWFSPADIEAPTLETIQFYDRSTGKSVELEKVPPVLFSEVMRDIDLVVSVAHAGGVDPETSHSTVEMRTAIARELVQLLRLPQVEFIGSHAKIHGKLVNYSVHMGSGVVHAEGRGMLAILPVHSQARGRIFLPFVDDDPKTAEIMSKIILLAEDSKIKDPTILGQLS